MVSSFGLVLHRHSHIYFETVLVESPPVRTACGEHYLTTLSEHTFARSIEPTSASAIASALATATCTTGGHDSNCDWESNGSDITQKAGSEGDESHALSDDGRGSRRAEHEQTAAP